MREYKRIYLHISCKQVCTLQFLRTHQALGKGIHQHLIHTFIPIQQPRPLMLWLCEKTMDGGSENYTPNARICGNRWRQLVTINGSNPPVWAKEVRNALRCSKLFQYESGSKVSNLKGKVNVRWEQRNIDYVLVLLGSISGNVSASNSFIDM